MLPLHSPILRGLECLLSVLVYRVPAKAGQSGCETVPAGECAQAFKVFPCKFGVPALSAEPISETVVIRKGCTAEGPEGGARVKTRSVL